MKKLTYSSLFYYFLRTFTFPLTLCSHRIIHLLGHFWGHLFYLLAPTKIKKTTYSNLAIARKLNLSEKQIKIIARKSFQNLAINALEYFRLAGSKKKMDRFVSGKNLEAMYQLLNSGQGVLCVTGHISNWELCFLDHTQKCAGTAVGKRIKNQKLYDFILSIRQMHGGDIIDMKDAVKEGIVRLKKGLFFSMVNDQAYTSSSYSYPFLGACAWTSAAPALIAYKANSPIFSVTTRRLKKGRYEYKLSEPIWPDKTKPLKSEVKRLMDRVMQDFEHEIEKTPEQWLWQHKRWKQEGYNYIIHKYKADAFLVVLPHQKRLFDWINENIWVIEQIYTRSFITFMVPLKYKNRFTCKGRDVVFYSNTEESCIRDYRFQMILDLSDTAKIKKHYFKLSAHKYFSLKSIANECEEFDLEKLNKSFYELCAQVLCLKEATFKVPSTKS